MGDERVLTWPLTVSIEDSLFLELRSNPGIYFGMHPGWAKRIDPPANSAAAKNRPKKSYGNSILGRIDAKFIRASLSTWSADRTVLCPDRGSISVSFWPSLLYKYRPLSYAGDRTRKVPRPVDSYNVLF
jgi:hypothetical protein